MRILAQILALFLYDGNMIATLRVCLPLLILVAAANFVYSRLWLPMPITFAAVLMIWMVVGMQRVFGRRFAASTMKRALRGILMAIVWPLVPKRS